MGNHCDFLVQKLTKEQTNALKAWQEKGKIPNPFDSDSKPIRARSMANAFQDSGLKLGRLFNCTFRVYLEAIEKILTRIHVLLSVPARTLQCLLDMVGALPVAT